jgi:RNA-splicing ligase RtcB
LLCLRPAAHFAPVHSRARDNDFHDLFTPDEHTQERADSNRQQQRRPGVACASIGSPIGEAYLGAMRAAINGKRMRLFVHRKGATRAFGPGHPAITENLKKTGQPVLIGGTMGTASYILSGTTRSMELAFGSACHGAGRSMSRHQALRQWQGKDIVQRLAAQGVLIRSRSMRGVAEEAPGAYKDVTQVVEAAHEAGLASTVARLEPLICIKG